MTSRPQTTVQGDTCIFAGSMAFEEGGSRIDDLKAILARVAEVGTLFDSDGILVSSDTAACPPLYLACWCQTGCSPPQCHALQAGCTGTEAWQVALGIVRLGHGLAKASRSQMLQPRTGMALPCLFGGSAGPASAHAQARSGVAAPADHGMLQVRFMNSNVCGDGITNPAAANNLISQVQFNGMTPLGTSLDNKVPGIMLDPTAACHSVCMHARLAAGLLDLLCAVVAGKLLAASLNEP